ncbi:MFS general substrate transporter [Amylocystis lapponica]|nr:MFS general substrate transporter [Amylocystis lapponica]
MSRSQHPSDAEPIHSDSSAIHPRDSDAQDDGSFVVEEELDTLRLEPEESRSFPMRAYLIRALALLCACCLSVGSHYASYILGPLKSRLSREMGTNNTEFSLLISAFSLNSTWTPLVGGVLASKLGTTYTSILATGVIFLGSYTPISPHLGNIVLNATPGQGLLLLGNLTDSVRLMTFGLFIYGLGVSPLAVVQETIIVRFFKSHGLGVSLALGLVAGKGASFISARTSYPLSDRFGPHAPFYAATLLTGLSFVVNLIYVAASKWLIRGAGAELEISDVQDEAVVRRQSGLVAMSEEEALKHVAQKRAVNLRDITKLGDVFWAYIGLNVFCGAIWAPFTHLAANVIERRFQLTESDASTKASYALAGSVLLYPVTGVIVDRVKKRGFTLQLLTVAACFTLMCYVWLALPPSWTKTPMPAIASFATGHGFSPLLLVVIVPQIVPHRYVATTLGAHKALEQTGSTIFQTLAGLALDVNSKKSTKAVAPIGDKRNVQHLLNAFVVFNVLQLVSIIALARLARRRREESERRSKVLLPAVVDEEEEPLNDSRAKLPVDEDAWTDHELSDATQGISRTMTMSQHDTRPPSTSSPEQRIPLLRPSSLSSTHRNSYLLSGGHLSAPTRIVRTKAEMQRGEVAAALSVMLIFLAWVLFIMTAWMKLRSKEERDGSSAVIP